jgi:hypothetical protein
MVSIVIWNGISENEAMKICILIMAVAGLWLPLASAQALELDAAAEAKRLEAGLTRLCGIWDWTVHSHSANHRESKAKIVLPSAQAAGIEGPSPTEIRIYGDAVYFRWDFPGGYQEDSMLFIEGRRLEGTFRTTTGSFGAINGKRVSACQATGPGAPGGADRKP